MWRSNNILILLLGLLITSFKFPDEKTLLGRKAANITVVDANGNEFGLFTLLKNKPLIISPVYTRCPSVCGVLSNGAKTAIDKLGTLGRDFTVISFSFDSSDKKEDLQNYESRWSMDGVNWKAVSASANDIKLLMKSIGFEYEFKVVTKEFDHPSLLVVLSPEGRISRYIYGINPNKKDIRLAIMEAAAEKSSPGIFQGLYLKCFAFDPLSKTFRIEWSFVISTSAGMLMIVIICSLFIKSFIVSKNQE